METLFFFKQMIAEYKSDKENQQNKKDCFKRYIKTRIDFLSHLIIAPVIYPIYYIFRKHLGYKVYNNFTKQYPEIFPYLDNSEESMNSFGLFLVYIFRDVKYDGSELRKKLKTCLNPIEYFLWESGDVEDPIHTGGCPTTYKPNKKSMFVRRWFWSAIRNPWYTRVFLKYHSNEIIDIKTTVDKKTEQDTSNYGTGNAKVGLRIRWYIDNKNKWYFYYENVYKSLLLGWREHYCGFVSISSYPDQHNDNGVGKKVYSERSNRPCKLI